MNSKSIKKAIAVIGIIIILGVIAINVLDRYQRYKVYKDIDNEEIKEKMAVVDTILQHREAFLDESFKNISKDELIAFLKKPNNRIHFFDEHDNVIIFVADGTSEPDVADIKMAIFDTKADAEAGIGLLGEKYWPNKVSKLTIRVPFALKNRDYLLQSLENLRYKKIKGDDAAEYFEGKPDIF